MVTLTRRALIVLAAAAFLACGKEPQASWTGTIDTLPNGTIVVSNPAKGIWDSANGLKLQEDLVIGGADNDTTMLSQVAALEVDPTGRIYVLDAQRQAVLVYDSAGMLLGTIGREGDGPGEFRRPNGLGWDNAGRLWVVEGPSMRYSVFDPAGDFIATHRRLTGSFGYWWQGRFLDDGRLLEPVSRRDSPTRSQPYVVRFDTAQGMVDSLELPFANISDDFFDFRDAQGVGTIMSIPYAPGNWSWIDPHGFVWLGTTDKYELVQIDLRGDTVRVIRKEHTPIAVNPAERDSVIAHVREIAQGHPFDAGRIPRVKPVLTRMLVDEDSNTWVMPVTSGRTTGTVFDVFDAVGRYLGQVTTPRRIGFWPMVFRRGKVYAVVVDTDDVPRVVRWRVVPPVPSQP